MQAEHRNGDIQLQTNHCSIPVCLGLKVPINREVGEINTESLGHWREKKGFVSALSTGDISKVG